jgi:hypothetical protein
VYYLLRHLNLYTIHHHQSHRLTQRQKLHQHRRHHRLKLLMKKQNLIRWFRGIQHLRLILGRLRLRHRL